MTETRNFRKKPADIRAWQWDGISKRPGWVFEVSNYYHPDKSLRVRTLEGVMTARVGDWIIEEVEGEIYPCKPDIFEKTYDEIVITVEYTLADSGSLGGGDKIKTFRSNDEFKTWLKIWVCGDHKEWAKGELVTISDYMSTGCCCGIMITDHDYLIDWDSEV